MYAMYKEKSGPSSNRKSIFHLYTLDIWNVETEHDGFRKGSSIMFRLNMASCEVELFQSVSGVYINETPEK